LFSAMVALATTFFSIFQQISCEVENASNPVSYIVSQKKGLSGLSRRSCHDAKTLNLDHNWAYNWGTDPDGSKYLNLPACTQPQVHEFVPMIWGCWGNCTDFMTPTLRNVWKNNNVQYLLGFNEPDNEGQSNLTPKQAALYWEQLDYFASTFDPPLKLIGPGMTHWDIKVGGSSHWLDQFFGNLSAPLRENIVALAQHDYSGDAQGIIDRANALYEKYNRKIWLTEFAVGQAASRATNNKFLEIILPLLESSKSIERYAWYSTRNSPDSWVADSSLLPPEKSTQGMWSEVPDTACASNEMLWLSQHQSLSDCQSNTIDNQLCASPKITIYESGDVKNCYCANVSTCTKEISSWQVLYEQRNGPVSSWNKIDNTACAENEMLWLSQHHSLEACETITLATKACASYPTKQSFYETGDVKNCYCSNKTGSQCKPQTSSWLMSLTQPMPEPLSMNITTTGKIYMQSPSSRN
jgi:hypothetical protein